jgi:hypothetical protein
MLKVADGRSVQRVVAQPPLLGKSLSKVNDSRQRCQAQLTGHPLFGLVCMAGVGQLRRSKHGRVEGLEGCLGSLGRW